MKSITLMKSDVIKSNILCISKKCYQLKKRMNYDFNKIGLNKKENGKYNINHFYVSNKNNSAGSWYNDKFNLVKSLNKKNKTINKKMIFEYFNHGIVKKYKVEIKIYLSEKGWKKLMKFIE